MGKREYTRASTAARAWGPCWQRKPQREVAEYRGFQNKQAANRLFERERRKERKPESSHNRKDVRGKMPCQETLRRGGPMRSGGSRV